MTHACDDHDAANLHHPPTFKGDIWATTAQLTSWCFALADTKATNWYAWRLIVEEFVHHSYKMVHIRLDCLNLETLQSGNSWHDILCHAISSAYKTVRPTHYETYVTGYVYCITFSIDCSLIVQAVMQKLKPCVAQYTLLVQTLSETTWLC